MNVKNKICVGLDIEDCNNLYKIFKIINATKKHAFCYKINPAFFAGNYNVFEMTLRALKSHNLKWIYDGKLGDVFHTNQKYAEFVYEKLGADGLTINPYVGEDALKPFFEYENKMNFLLCRTTNQGADLLQKNNYQKVYNMSKNLKAGLVIPGNKKDFLNDAIKNNPGTLILSPGIGVQGGKINISNPNIIFSISRSIINSDDIKEEIKKYVY